MALQKNDFVEKMQREYSLLINNKFSKNIVHMICSLLKDIQPANAGDIAEYMNKNDIEITIHEMNVILYSNSHIFEKHFNGGKYPFWSVLKVKIPHKNSNKDIGKIIKLNKDEINEVKEIKEPKEKHDQKIIQEPAIYTGNQNGIKKQLIYLFMDVDECKDILLNIINNPSYQSKYHMFVYPFSKRNPYYNFKSPFKSIVIANTYPSQCIEIDIAMLVPTLFSTKKNSIFIIAGDKNNEYLKKISINVNELIEFESYFVNCWDQVRDILNKDN